tara:strand:- start:2120 stop:3532 length:1413 start_codon:yes stop_codon:yes gene_type:complete
MPSAILVHKVPALWEVECRGKKGKDVKLTTKFDELDDISEKELHFLKQMRDDIFFLLTESLSNYLQIDHIHVILCYDKKEIRNWDIIEREGRIDLGDGFIFWSSNSMEKLPKILDSEILIVRGNYPNFHNKIISSYSPKSTLFYPATSLLFPHFDSRLKTWLKGVLDGSVGFSEMKNVISKLSEETLFSRFNTPKLSKPKNKNQDLELRRLVRNYCLECAKIATNVRNRKSPGKYPIVLYDEVDNLDTLRKKYPNSELLKFNKASSPLFQLDLQKERDIDIIFTGTTIQKTKNQFLFYELLDRILKIRPETKVVIVGVENNLDELSKRWESYDVQIFPRVEKRTLSELYNRSKTHMITSGRDCFPRTIPESISCGCFNIILDILSDGLSLIKSNPLLGKVIDTSGSIPLLEPNYNISLSLNSDSIEKQIIEQLDIEHNPLGISLLGASLMPLGEMVQMDKVWEIIDLSNF